MKRLLLRLSALSLVVMLGLIAIARAQRSGSAGSSSAGSGNAQSSSGDPFANSQSLATQAAGDTATASSSSVRMVGVQDFPSNAPDVQPRSVANDTIPPDAPDLTIHRPSNGTQTAAADAPAASDPLGLRSTISTPPSDQRPAADAATSGGSLYTHNATLASATAPVSTDPATPGATGTNPPSLEPITTGRPVEVAQAPAAFEPPPSAAPLSQSDSPPISPEQVAQPASATTSNLAPENIAGGAPPTQAIQQTDAQLPSPPAARTDADTGPMLTPIAPPAASAPTPTIGLRPIEPTAPAASDAALHVPQARVGDAKHVEGSQSPQLTIEKIAPSEVQVGKPARFELRVRNVGSAAADGVEIHDAVPQGMQFISSNPPTTQGPHGQLVWSLGELRPGEQTSVELKLLPIAEGDIRSMATVTFRTEVSVHTLATRPRLVVQLSAPKKVLIGEQATIGVQISNPGTGAATGVVLTEKVPRGLQHRAGSNLEFEVGTLAPGQTRQIELTMSAVEAGHVINALQAHGDGTLHAQSRVEFDVVAPALSVAMTGPTRRFLERQATYTVAVSNPGTAPARDVELVTELPKGMKFVKANNAGHYDPQTHTVTWNLQELPPAETGSVTLVAVPIEAGEQHMKIEGKARQGLSDAKEKTVLVEGLAAVTFDVRGMDEAIEVGGETTYQIHVANEGTIAATNLQICAIFPPEMKPIRADGPSRNMLERRTVQFEPIPRLEPKGEATFRIRAHALQAGDLRIKVQVQSDDMHQPVTKEENTRVYVDR